MHEQMRKCLFFQIFPGNKNAYDQAGFGSLGVDARSLRFISSAYVGQPCMRVEIWGLRKYIYVDQFLFKFRKNNFLHKI